MLSGESTCDVCTTKVVSTLEKRPACTVGQHHRKLTMKGKETYKNKENVQIVTGLNHDIIVENLTLIVVNMPHASFVVQLFIWWILGVLFSVVRRC
jgi:hypothetical protein